MIAVEFSGLGKVFGDCRSVDDVSAKFEAGKIHAILGENGAGKSTLMKLLFGLHQPSEGSLSVKGVQRKWSSPADAMAAGLGMVQQHFSLVESLSVVDNIMLGAETTQRFGVLDRAEACRHLESYSELKLNWNQIVSELSVGEKQKVEILKLIARQSDILVLDEPTAVLAPKEIENLFSLLKSLRDRGRTIFVITHKLGEVFDHCDTWFVLRSGRAIANGAVANSKVQDVVRAMIGAELPPLRTPEKVASGDCRLRFQKVSAVGGAHKLREVSFELRSGEILGVAGVDGSGQSELVSSLLGLSEFEGAVEILGELLPNQSSSNKAAATLERLRSRGLAIIGEDRHTQSLWLDESVELNAGLGVDQSNGFFRGGWLRSRVWRERVAEWLKAFDVRFPSFEISVHRLSGGNQQKLVFARELLGRNAKLIVAHQPTRGVDFAAIRLIYERLFEARKAGAAIIVISSELDELMTLSDRMIVLCSGRKTGEFVRESSGAAYDRTAIGLAMTASGPTQKTSTSIPVAEVIV